MFVKVAASTVVIQSSWDTDTCYDWPCQCAELMVTPFSIGLNPFCSRCCSCFFMLGCKLSTLGQHIKCQLQQASYMLETLFINAPYLVAKSSSGSNLPCTVHLSANQIWDFCSFTLVHKMCCFWMPFVNVRFDKFTDVAGCLFKPHGTFSVVISGRFQIDHCKCEE